MAGWLVKGEIIAGKEQKRGVTGCRLFGKCPAGGNRAESWHNPANNQRSAGSGTSITKRQRLAWSDCADAR